MVDVLRGCAHIPAVIVALSSAPRDRTPAGVRGACPAPPTRTVWRPELSHVCPPALSCHSCRPCAYSMLAHPHYALLCFRDKFRRQPTYYTWRLDRLVECAAFTTLGTTSSTSTNVPILNAGYLYKYNRAPRRSIATAGSKLCVLLSSACPAAVPSPLRVCHMQVHTQPGNDWIHTFIHRGIHLSGCGCVPGCKLHHV